VAECRRVARTYVAIVVPYQHPAVEESERLLQRFLKEKLGVEHRYLEEHRHHGLPDRATTEAQLAASGASVASLGHGNLERWLALICLSLYMDYTHELRGVATRFFRFYNGQLYASDHAEPVYRHAVVAGLRGAPMPTGRRALAPAATPPGAVARITELAFEVADFERAHRALHEEREALRHMLSERDKDLAGHKQALAEERAARARVEKQTVEIQDGLREVLRQNDAKITELRALLRGRWRNLKRALGQNRPIP
jgi:hypothetical protein